MVCLLCVGIWASVFAVIGYILKKFGCGGCCQNKYPVPEIHKKDFVKDRVYLYEFPNGTNHNNPSPYCVKLEMFLKMNDFDYESIPTMEYKSRYGKIPFIEVNGEHIADSQLAIERLKVLFPEKVKSEKLNDVQKATARVVQRMVDSHTTFMIAQYKMVEQPEEFTTWTVDYMIKNCIKSPRWQWVKNYPGFLGFMVKMMAIRKYKKLIAAVIGPFVEVDMESEFRRDLDVIKAFIEGNKFVTGDVPSEADAAIYGQFAPLFITGYRTRAGKIFLSDYPSLIEYLNRLQQLYFPDLEPLKIL